MIHLWKEAAMSLSAFKFQELEESPSFCIEQYFNALTKNKISNQPMG